MTDPPVACSQTTTYHPLLRNHTHVVVCRRPAGHDGMHEGEGFGSASVVWDRERAVTGADVPPAAQEAMVPAEAIRAALQARDESQSMTDEGLTRDMLEAAAPHMWAAALQWAAQQWRAILVDHYLMGVNCDPETKQDNPVCQCSRVHLGWHPSIGAAVDAWIEHVASLLRQEGGGT